MEVILLDDVKGLGERGSRVQVARGYARNFLLPRKLAVQAGKAGEVNRPAWRGYQHQQESQNRYQDSPGERH